MCAYSNVNKRPDSSNLNPLSAAFKAKDLSDFWFHMLASEFMNAALQTEMIDVCDIDAQRSSNTALFTTWMDKSNVSISALPVHVWRSLHPPKNAELHDLQRHPNCSTEKFNKTPLANYSTVHHSAVGGRGTGEAGLKQGRSNLTMATTADAMVMDSAVQGSCPRLTKKLVQIMAPRPLETTSFCRTCCKLVRMYTTSLMATDRVLKDLMVHDK